MKAPWYKQHGRREDKAIGLPCTFTSENAQEVTEERKEKRRRGGKGGKGRGRGREEAACTHKSTSWRTCVQN